MYRGIYDNKQKHPDDYEHVLERSWTNSLDKIIITVGAVNEADEALRLASQDDRLYVTMGCHPTRCNAFLENPTEYYGQISKYIEDNRSKVVAIGECGLDYDRLHFCAKETQLIYFEKQLDLAERYALPLFLHSRAAHNDFVDIIERNREKVKNGGVVHSFDGTLSEARQLINYGFYIGINGCSLKTQDQLDSVAQIPNDRILIETDAPWCSVRPSHAGSKYVKTKFPSVKKKERWTKEQLVDGRNEPAQIVQVLEIIAAIKGDDAQVLAEQFYTNTIELFFKIK